MTIIRFIMSLVGFPHTPTMQVTQRVLEVFECSVKKHPPSPISPVNYHHDLTQSYGWLNTPRLPELQACKVTKLGLYKCSNNFQHEFVLAHVEHFNSQYGTQSRVFLLERDSDPTTISQIAGSLTPKTSKPNINPAIDRLFIYETLAEALAATQGDLCYEVIFSSPQPNVLDLASAAAALSIVAPSYNLTSHMCFWYANSLCRLLAHERDYEVQEKYKSKKSRRAGYFGSLPVLEQSGKLVVHDSPSSDVVDELRRHPEVFILPSSNPSEAVNPDSSSLTAHPKGKFVRSDIVIGYYRTFVELLMDAEAKIKSLEDERNGDVDQRIDQANQLAIQANERADQMSVENRQMSEENRQMREENMDLRRQLEEAKRALQASTSVQT